MTAVIMDQIPPALQGPSDKEKKYDRQLRLWAASGQQALEDAHILLINSGSGTVGVETLKNLVLPGIGKFTIADDAEVEEADLGVNFFLDEDCLGKSRSESCVRLLQELNPDVKGDWFPREKGEPLNTLLDSTKFTLIIYTLPITPERLALVESYSKNHKVPAVAVHSAGFYSYFRIHLPGPFPIVDTHPDPTATTDLRLLTPWEELSTFAEDLTKDLENQSALEHGHIPYVALTLHYLNVWKDSHGSFPTTYKEKQEFKKIMAAGARTNTAEGGEENFDEAVAAVLKTVSEPTLSSSVKEVFEHKPNETESNSSFWVIADAVRQFYEKHKVLPLPGSVPDMKAQSAVYVQLQNIYKDKARKDVAEVLETVRAHPEGKTIDLAEVEAFCKNAAFIKLVHGGDFTPPVDLQSIADKEAANDEMAALSGLPLSLLPIYVSLQATSHAPDATSAQILSKVDKSIPNAWESGRFQEAAEEVARAKGGELHNISALTGGMVSQEVIKIITKQYIPIDNTCIYDGITSRTQILRI